MKQTSFRWNQSCLNISRQVLDGSTQPTDGNRHDQDETKNVYMEPDTIQMEVYKNKVYTEAGNIKMDGSMVYVEADRV